MIITIQEKLDQKNKIIMIMQLLKKYVKLLSKEKLKKVKIKRMRQKLKYIQKLIKIKKIQNQIEFKLKKQN